MGGCISTKLAPQPDAVEVLLIGPASAGKTALVQQLQQINNTPGQLRTISTVPTNGFERVDLKVQQKTVVLKELGASLRPTWHSYYGRSDVIAYVIDASSIASAVDVITDLKNLFDWIRAQPNVPRLRTLLICLNKSSVTFSFELLHSR